eukprot:TRINITY_DN3338_c0_g1_i1.p1 TRINITY_DN3338_c0_g1~~TRINITY_DN3338_c0_g1_i1.p1  ORF type:complete len:1375 (+),score=593.47 TRINITY_DN3338_c0_g1_i1:69-4193(+)
MKPSTLKADNDEPDAADPADDLAMEYVSFPSQSVAARTTQPPASFQARASKRHSLPPPRSELGVIPASPEQFPRAHKGPAPLPHIAPGKPSPQPARRAASVGASLNAVALAEGRGGSDGASPIPSIQPQEMYANEHDMMLMSMGDFTSLPSLRQAIDRNKSSVDAAAADQPSQSKLGPPPSGSSGLNSSVATEVDQTEARGALGTLDVRAPQVGAEPKTGIPLQEMDYVHRGKELSDTDVEEEVTPPPKRLSTLRLSIAVEEQTQAQRPDGTGASAVTANDLGTSDAGAKEKLKGLKARLKGKRKWTAYPAVYVNDKERNEDKGFSTNLQRTTKYTPWTFLPKNLFEQFRRATNVYFLAITIVTCIPQVSPFNPYTTVAALVFVLLVAAVKEAYEDIMRYKADKSVNEKVFKVRRADGTVDDVQSQDLKVGDVLCLSQDEHVPADSVLLWSAHEEDGLCFVDTAQLDGETSLKELRALQETYSIDEGAVQSFRGRIRLEVPHSDLYTFRANLEVLESTRGSGQGQRLPLDKKQLLLRGARIRNTPYVYGVIVYAGKDTKLALNQKNPPHKFSRTERLMNKIVLALVVFQLVCMAVCAIGAAVVQSQSGEGRRWYLGAADTDSSSISAVLAFFSYFVLLSYVVPMSMMVSLEIIKVVQGIMIGWDEKMHVDPTDKETGAMARNSNLNDELGRVKYIFSDKTGTLTENKMVFSKASICSRQFDDPINGELGNFLKENQWDSAKEWTYGDLTTQVGEFLRGLALCHAAVIEVDATGSKYQASSPDEIALCHAAKVNQFEFSGRKAGTISVSEFGVERVYQVLNTMEFTSDRRRMSVIIRTPEGQIRMYSKGADSVMWDRLANVDVQAAERKTTSEQISNFSKEGLRTLIVGSKVLSEDDYAKFNREFVAASASVANREEQVEAVADKMERGLRLVGATAVEDRLQDGVPETLAYLLKAGIKIWMITGDKQETAINIGHSSRLLSTEQLLVVVDGDSSDAARKQIDAGNAAKASENIGLVINGASLAFCLLDHKDQFVKLCFRATSVVVCRATPLQKAQIVNLVKENDKTVVTLAIGDGANDVSMIQAGHIGIGIFGKEGTQAARASDYALQQFSHLRRLLTIHGRYGLIRNSGLIQMSLYKNIAFFYALFWFSFYNGFSGQSIIDDWIVTVFNIVIAALPPLFYAIFEKDVSERIVEQTPELYIEISSARRTFSPVTISMWLASALFHSVVLFWAAVLLMQNDAILTTGLTMGLWGIGGIYASSGLFVTFGKMYMEHSLWNGGTLLGLFLSLLAYFMLLLTISSMPALWPQSLGVIYMIFKTPVFYLYCAAVFGVCMLPEFSVKYWLRQYYPMRWHIVQEKDRMVRAAARKKKVPSP